MSHVIEVETSQGPGRMVVDGVFERPSRLLVLGHGAGGGIEAPDLLQLAHRLPSDTSGSITVARFEQPWRTAGRKVAVAPRRLDEAMCEALPQLVDRLRPGTLVLGGRSAGARVACRTGRELGAAGIVALSFPLHPPGRPEKSRADELLGSALPALVVQGERDPFGGPAEFAGLLAEEAELQLLAVAGARHELVPPVRGRQEPELVWAAIASRVAAFVRGTAGE